MASRKGDRRKNKTKRSETKKSKDWEVFEKVIAEVHQAFDPTASVTHNEKIKGRSGRRRQIDVAIRREICGHAVLGVVECKKYKRRVGIGNVDGFLGKLDDVGGSFGVLISDGGFDAGAVERAKDSRRVQLCSVISARCDWLRQRLTIPIKVVAIETIVKDLKIHFDQGPLFTKGELISKVRPYESEIYETFKRFTETEEVPEGDHVYEGNHTTGPIGFRIFISFSRTIKAFQKNVPLAGDFVRNHLTGSIVAASSPSFQLDVWTNIESWEEVPLSKKVPPHGFEYRSCRMGDMPLPPFDWNSIILTDNPSK